MNPVSQWIACNVAWWPVLKKCRYANSPMVTTETRFVRILRMSISSSSVRIWLINSASETMPNGLFTSSTAHKMLITNRKYADPRFRESLSLNDLKTAQKPNVMSQNATILSSQITNEFEVKINECMRINAKAKYVHPFWIRFSFTCENSHGIEYLSIIGASMPLMIPRETPRRTDHSILRFSGLNIKVNDTVNSVWTMVIAADEVMNWEFNCVITTSGTNFV
ncbi:hypothetical protein OGAPHI_003631 [Ogataea philodendri]|uniref:Uncharacterized protein n=1 Tax=Ogataea philodendri TaxID=1378263 RepID=A0A9P8P596_9ASCO|nr:uncharacterized protein OGAPHI_003631 [Ogataea philodendri]KAH3665447.1 hypothetical protein OGAPHI_003631 [Ogataea philodendri]